jgi:hypothetical protein
MVSSFLFLIPLPAMAKAPLADTLLNLEAGLASAVAGSLQPAARAWGGIQTAPSPLQRDHEPTAHPRNPSQVLFKSGPEHMGPNQLSPLPFFLQTPSWPEQEGWQLGLPEWFHT